MSQANATKLFGTDGIRGRAGEFPLDEATVERIGRALVINIGRHLGHAPRLLIGRDTRQSGPHLQAALSEGLAAEGVGAAAHGPTREHGGLGLGLPLSKRIVEQHQGRIWLESNDRRGCTAFVSLPLSVSVPLTLL